jgi:hypothetical protein
MRNLAQINERLVLGSGEDGVNDRMWVIRDLIGQRIPEDYQVPSLIRRWRSASTALVLG